MAGPILYHDWRKDTRLYEKYEKPCVTSREEACLYIHASKYPDVLRA